MSGCSSRSLKSCITRNLCMTTVATLPCSISIMLEKLTYYMLAADDPGERSSEHAQANTSCLQGSSGRGKERGNGRVVVTRLADGDGSHNSSCVWETVKVIEVPKTANFEDYSDLAIQTRANSSVARVLITSQEDAAVWAGLLDLEKFEFLGEGVVLHFPRSAADCKMVYCNIEGVQFVDECAVTSSFHFLDC